MSRFDDAGDAAASFALVSMMAADPERHGRFLRRRTAAALWVPALLVAALAGGYSRNGILGLVALVALSAAILVYSERPGILFRR